MQGTHCSYKGPEFPVVHKIHRVLVLWTPGLFLGPLCQRERADRGQVSDQEAWERWSFHRFPSKAVSSVL